MFKAAYNPKYNTTVTDIILQNHHKWIWYLLKIMCDYNILMSILAKVSTVYWNTMVVYRKLVTMVTTLFGILNFFFFLNFCLLISSCKYTLLVLVFLN